MKATTAITTHMVCKFSAGEDIWPQSSQRGLVWVCEEVSRQRRAVRWRVRLKFLFEHSHVLQHVDRGRYEHRRAFTTF